MPGLVGLITRMPRERAEAELLRMVAALRHETSYASGTWIDESLGAYVGWVERSGPFAECMPLGNESGRSCSDIFGRGFSDADDCAAA